ncbi:MAG: hypothetical protein MI919_24800, partial [Holophagales bacterium]|nr:hypothetical protein [Holophagales bacterium]
MIGAFLAMAAPESAVTYVLGLPWVLPLGLLAGLVLVARSVQLLLRRRVSRRRVIALSALRLLGLFLLVLLLARPTAVLDRDAALRRTVALLLDHSASMDLDDGQGGGALGDGLGRYTRAVAWARDHLEPAFRTRGFRVEVSLFDGTLERVSAASQLEA